MRILVVSDTHGDLSGLKEVIDKSRSSEVVIHCGDGADEIQYLRELYPEKMFIFVRGNCDFCTDAPYREVITLEGKRIFITHGHLYSVKSGLYPIACAAKEQGADIVLFGHTHQSVELYDDGLYMLNPGSLRGYDGSYGYVDISPSGVLTNVVRR